MRSLSLVTKIKFKKCNINVMKCLKIALSRYKEVLKMMMSTRIETGLKKIEKTENLEML